MSRLGDLGGTALLAGAAALGIAASQAPLNDAHRHVHETTDVYVLPPPEEVVTMSLGYRAALADVLWADALVSQGLHMQEHRHYHIVGDLISAINALDPEFRSPYLMADALITFQIGEPSHEEVVEVRKILERGTKNLPLDAEMWLDLGSFVAFVAPGTYLTDPAEKQQWKLDGAADLARAAELAGDDSSIAWRALGGAGVYGRAGQHEAMVRFYQRACAVTDDKELLAQCEKLLGKAMDAERRERVKRMKGAFEAAWNGDLPFVSLAELLVLGPPRDVAYCAGGTHEDDPKCAGTWRAWADLVAPPAH
ncbi:MAG TPA: hypothetical protein VHB21_09430 [Minicystis sp.]|nr:hypothetical protein [Minicystis sp.]